MCIREAHVNKLFFSYESVLSLIYGTPGENLREQRKSSSFLLYNINTLNCVTGQSHTLDGTRNPG